MPSNRVQNTLMKPLVTLALPGMYLVYKYNQFKRHHQESSRRKVTEKELLSLNHKIDKLLAKLDEHDAECHFPEEEECVVCLSAKATMQTFPCGHKVVCRKCFVKTIQVAVAQRCLPLKCVVCRSRVLKLKQSDEESPTSRSSSPKLSSGSKLFAKLFSSKSSSQSQQQAASVGAGLAASAIRETSSASNSPCHSRRGADKRHHSGTPQRQLQQPVVSTKLMQPWLIYPSVNSPKHQRAFMGESAPHHSRSSSQASSSHKELPAVSALRQVGPFSPAQRRPKHHCSPLTSSRIAELKHAHMLSPRVPRCSHCIQQQGSSTAKRAGAAN